MSPAASPSRRALACAVAIASVVVVTRAVIERAALAPTDALALDALASACVLALAACALAGFSREPLDVRLGLGAGRLGSGTILLATFGLIALSHAAEAAIALSGIVSPALVRIDDALGGIAPADLAFPLLAIGLASAAGEELFFRGWLQRGLASRLPSSLAIALAALAFGAAHGDLVHAAVATVLGAYVGSIAACAGSIRPAIAAHAANNAAVLVQKAAGLEILAGDRTALAIFLGGVTFAGVALVTLFRHTEPRGGLQTGSGPADEASGA